MPAQPCLIPGDYYGTVMINSRARPRASLELRERAYRRPIALAEIERRRALYDEAAAGGEPPESAIRVPIEAILVSPDFLYEVEKDGPSDDPRAVRPLNEYELATRLSYFPWSTMPDDVLLREAAAGRLQDPEALEAQARRMLRSAISIEIADVFAMQWLQLEALEAIMPDPVLFPTFYVGDTPKAMRIEAALFFETVVAEDRSLLEFLDSDWTYLNPLLPQVYGIGPERGKGDWKRVELPDARRGGVITMAGVLAVTSGSTRTNPVKRGEWLLETILGARPPPSLPSAGTIPDEPTAAGGPRASAPEFQELPLSSVLGSTWRSLQADEEAQRSKPRRSAGPRGGHAGAPSRRGCRSRSRVRPGDVRALPCSASQAGGGGRSSTHAPPGLGAPRRPLPSD
jgi:hypothetical protein